MLFVILLDLSGNVIEGDEVETEMFKYSGNKIDAGNMSNILGQNSEIVFTKLRVFQFSAVKKKMS